MTLFLLPETRLLGEVFLLVKPVIKMCAGNHYFCFLQIVFLLNVVNIIGLILIIVYMSYGMTSLPLGMIRGRSEVHAERATVEEQVRNLSLLS